MKRAKKTKLHGLKPGRSLQTPTSKGSPVSLSSETESSGDDSDSPYESDSSPPPEKSPLPASRPQKAVEAVRYDTIKAVWFPRNKFAENDRILKGLADLWEVVRTIRDRWKTDRDAVKKALESKQDSELPLLRERVDKQLEMMEAVLTAAVEFGHPDLLSAYVSPLTQIHHALTLQYAYIRDAGRLVDETMSMLKDDHLNNAQNLVACHTIAGRSSLSTTLCSSDTISLPTQRHLPKVMISLGKSRGCSNSIPCSTSSKLFFLLNL